ncbi:MAG TPA: C40 family peptidase [Gemmatimonadales bacterium]
MSRLIARAAIVPVMREPSLRSEQMSQLVLGETARLDASQREWRRVTTEHDGYGGWVHAGYVLEVDEDAALRWRAAANGWSLCAVLRLNGGRLRLPLRARTVVEGDTIGLPDGRRGTLAEGAVPDAGATARAARAVPPERWALEHFAGAPYEWGGVTPWGVDCSGLVQTTFAVREVALPRDSALQVERGAPVAPDALRPGDLLFFRGEEGPGITHVAFAGDDDTLIHSTVSCGGVLRESWLPGTRAAPLRDRLVAVRRLEDR